MDFGGGTVAQNGAVAFVASRARHPGELFYLPPNLSNPRELTDYNAPIARLDLAPSTEFTWHNDGFTEDGVLTYPLGYVRGRKYPLALVIHGGPTDGASTVSFSALNQILAAAGFFVLQPNYRGSDNLGYKYATAIIGSRPIVGVGSDVYAGTKALLATGMIDSSRVGASGWSAGGWTTSWLITHYPLYKAAVTGAAIDDAAMQATFSQINDYAPILFGGLTPWSSRGMQVYRQNSPVTFAKNVTAATLILSDTNDPRVPTPQSYEFFEALRAYGKNVEFIAIPAYGHHPADPDRNKAIDQVWANWLMEHLSH
jgi:dipeptidyl aminopeptidase/acylaminoacyl peptidase